VKRATLRDLQRLPKVELHGHIDGYLSPTDVLEIARRHKRRIVTLDGRVMNTKKQLLEFSRGDGYESLLQQIVNRFSPVTGLMQTEETIRDVAVAYVRRLAEEGIIYAEGRFAPQFHTKEGLTMSDAVRSMQEGLREGRENFGVRTNLIVCINREADSEAGENVARVALEFAGRGVVALDLACNEKGFPPEQHLPAYEMTFDSSLRRTVHAGEGCGTVTENLHNIRTAIELLRAEGLGHAIHLALDEDLMRTVAERGIRVESNPVSNLTLGYISSIRELQIEKLLRQQVLVSINSDDPAMWDHGSLSENLYAVATAYGFNLNDLKTLILNGTKSAFASEKEKAELAAKVSDSWRD
jgi:adenosine deaminase